MRLFALERPFNDRVPRVLKTQSVIFPSCWPDALAYSRLPVCIQCTKSALRTSELEEMRKNSSTVFRFSQIKYVMSFTTHEVQGKNNFACSNFILCCSSHLIPHSCELKSPHTYLFTFQWMVYKNNKIENNSNFRIKKLFLLSVSSVKKSVKNKAFN